MFAQDYEQYADSLMENILHRSSGGMWRMLEFNGIVAGCVYAKYVSRSENWVENY